MGYFGPVAQLGAHYIRIVGVGSSNLLRSTKNKCHLRVAFIFGLWRFENSNATVLWTVA